MLFFHCLSTLIVQPGHGQAAGASLHGCDLAPRVHRWQNSPSSVDEQQESKGFIHFPSPPVVSELPIYPLRERALVFVLPNSAIYV